MVQNDADQTGSGAGWQGALISAWVCGALVLQVHFQLGWKAGNGGFGRNLLMGLFLVFAGILVFAGVARLFRALSRGNATLERRLCRVTKILLWSSSVLFALSLGVPKLFFPISFWLGAACSISWVIYSVRAINAAEIDTGQATIWNRFLQRAKSSARQPWAFNGLFWLLVFLTLAATDLYTISNRFDGTSGFETITLIGGRILTNAAFTLALILAVKGLLAIAPRALYGVVLGTASLIPFALLADFGVRRFWNKNLVEVLNDFTVSGRFNVRQELEASGLPLTPLQAGLVVLLLAAVCFGFFLYMQRLSSKLGKFRLNTLSAGLVFAAVWLVAIVEQGLSMATKRTEIWQKEHSMFSVHMGIFSPPLGLETIPVQVSTPQPRAITEQLLAEAADLPELEHKPDIFILMVESWRSDSISEEVTPFLYRFANTDCQEFGNTYAGSNCTPLSWFTLFHSRVALHWADTVKGAETPEGLPGAYPVRLLKELGYKVSARAVCDLGYKKLGELNFGTDNKLADAFRDSNELPYELEFPEREDIIVEDLKKQVRQSQPGGHLHFIAFDSPHYHYYWPEEGFEPLHSDCDGTINYTNINPSEEEIIEVQKRYHNSVNFMDEQIMKFVNFLKHEGRYDDATIIITGDHGEEFQEHGSWFHCSTLKREQTEVPIMIKWPSWMETPPAQPQVSHLDVMPSVLHMLGLDEKFRSGLSGHSVLDEEHPGETFISTIHRGMTNVGVCLIKDGTKANFSFRGLWEGGLPDELFLQDYTDLNDQRVSVLEERGLRSHTDFLRERFPVSTSRLFDAFGEPEEPEPELSAQR